MEGWRWEEDGCTVTRSTCWSGPGTHGGCGVLLYEKDGKLVKVEGDPECPFNQGRACVKTLSLPRFIDHPQRLKYPLKRVGERGENKWERISWDEALDTIVDEFNRMKDSYGAESVFFVQGTGRDGQAWVDPACHFLRKPQLRLFCSGQWTGLLPAEDTVFPIVYRRDIKCG